MCLFGYVRDCMRICVHSQILHTKTLKAKLTYIHGHHRLGLQLLPAVGLLLLLAILRHCQGHGGHKAQGDQHTASHFRSEEHEQ